MKKIDLTKFKKPYFIGIGGIGISAIARMFLLDGNNPSGASGRVRVSGSDVAESEVTEGLREVGAMITIQAEEKMGIFQQSAVRRCPSGIPNDCDLVVYTIAIPEDHPELVEAKKRGILLMSYPEALGEISRGKFTIAVSGTHGKTTTTAMIAKILMDAGFDPTVIIGSLITRSDLVIQGRTLERTNFIGGKGKYLVVEACEYKRSFLNLSPKVLVITNIDNDHLDYYKDIDDIESAFAELSAKVPKNGTVVCDFSDKRAKRATSAGKGKTVDFSKYLSEVPKLLIPGTHNKKNAAAALAVADFLGVDAATAKKSLSEFRGTWRRFEFRGKANPPAGGGALVYDDYGHHPTEIKATLAGARELFPTQKIVVVFQPHLYSRTKDHLKAFGKCFKDADEVIVLPIYPAREKDPGDISSEMVVSEIKKNSQFASFVATFAVAAEKSATLTGPNDVIITMGAGETNKVADALVNRSVA